MEINQAFQRLIGQIVELLPGSPFRPFLDQMESLPWLPVLNWLYPVRQCLNVLAAWLGAYALFLLYSVVMRWVKMIGD